MRELPTVVQSEPPPVDDLPTGMATDKDSGRVAEGHRVASCGLCLGAAVLDVKHRRHDRLAIGRLPPRRGAAEVGGPGVGVLEVGEGAGLVAQLEHRDGRLWGQVATARTRTRAGKSSSFQMGVWSLNGSDTTSSTPIHREMPVR